MDIKLLLSTFWAVFLAELGDKTQIATFTLASATNRRWSVFVGASAALVTSTLLAILAADQLAKHINLRLTQAIAGALLMVMGALYLVTALRSSGGG